MNQPEEKDSKEFVIIGLFAVTGFCFFMFSVAMKLLEGSYLPLFNKIGIACACLAGLCLFIKWVDSKKNKSRSNSSLLQEE